MVMEFSVGRSSQKSAARSFHALEPAGTKWHFLSYIAIAGNYLLMMFYTTVGGWMLSYVVKMIKGEFTGLDRTLWALYLITCLPAPVPWPSG